MASLHSLFRKEYDLKQTHYRVCYYDLDNKFELSEIEFSPEFVNATFSFVKKGVFSVPLNCKDHLPYGHLIALHDFTTNTGARWNEDNSPLIVMNDDSAAVVSSDILKEIADKLQDTSETKPVFIVGKRNPIFSFFVQAILFDPCISLIGTTGAATVARDAYLVNKNKLLDAAELRSFIVNKESGLTIIPEELNILSFRKNVLSLPFLKFISSAKKTQDAILSRYQMIELYDLPPLHSPNDYIESLSVSSAHIILRAKKPDDALFDTLDCDQIVMRKSES